MGVYHFYQKGLEYELQIESFEVYCFHKALHLLHQKVANVKTKLLHKNRREFLAASGASTALAVSSYAPAIQAQDRKIGTQSRRPDQVPHQVRRVHPLRV